MKYKKNLLIIVLISLILFLLGFNIFLFINKQKLKSNFSINFINKKIKSSNIINENINNSDDKIEDNLDVGMNQLGDIDNNNVRQDIKLLFFGDLMLDRHVGEKINRYGFDYLISPLKDFISLDDYDLIGANLEGAVTDNGGHYKPDNLYDFAFSPDLIIQLKKYNFNFFNLANNHLADQGLIGVDETYKNLSLLDFYYSGCVDAYLSPSIDFIETSINEPMPILSKDNCSEIILEINDKKVALLGVSMVYNQIEEKKLIEKIKELQEKSDWLLINIHFGNEYQSTANKYQVSLARKLVDSGADVIIGHHPHVVQNYEIYNNKPIFYSLGNFIFDQYFSVETQEGIAVSLNLNNDGDIPFEVYKIKTSGSRIQEIIKIP